MEDVKLGEPQVCPACKALNPAGLYLPFECLKCAETPKEKKDDGSKVPCSAGLSDVLHLLKKDFKLSQRMIDDMEAKGDKEVKEIFKIKRGHTRDLIEQVKALGR